MIRGVASRPNVFAGTFSRERGDLRVEPVASKAGAEQLGGTLHELPPGSAGAPLHVLVFDRSDAKQDGPSS